MKTLIIALMAFALILGVSCKKNDDVVSVSSKIEKKEVKSADLKAKVLADAEATGEMGSGDEGIGGYPGGANTYPHNTGACYCGNYSVCHPVNHNPSCPAAKGTGGCIGCPKSGN